MNHAVYCMSLSYCLFFLCNPYYTLSNLWNFSFTFKHYNYIRIMATTFLMIMLNISEDVDYHFIDEGLIFSASNDNTRNASFEVHIINDDIPECFETFEISVTSVFNAAIQNSVIRVVIPINDEGNYYVKNV